MLLRSRSYRYGPGCGSSGAVAYCLSLHRGVVKKEGRIKKSDAAIKHTRVVRPPSNVKHILETGSE